MCPMGGQLCEGHHNKVSLDQKTNQAMPQNVTEFIMGGFTYRKIGLERTDAQAVLGKLFATNRPLL